MLDSKKFAWLYLVKNGVAGRKPEYYGGHRYTPEALKKYPKAKSWYGIEEQDIVQVGYSKDLKEIGVNWEKTSAPTSESRSQFNGTFADTTYEEYLEGELILLNGEKQIWCAEALEISNVFDMMAETVNAPNEFIEIFGDLV